MSKKSDIASWSKEHKEEFLNNAYLEIGDTYNLNVQSIFDPFNKPADTLEEFVNFCTHPDYLHVPAQHIMNMDLFPYQMAILKTLWTHSFPMLLAARGGAKTTLLALYVLLRATFDQGIKIVVAGAGLRQSGLVFAAMQQIWDNAPILRDIAGGAENRPKRSTTGYHWQIGKSMVIGIPIGTGEKIRGLRANVIVVDEFGSINPDIYETVIRGFASVQSQNTVEKVKDAYKRQVLKELGLENVFDQTDELDDGFKLKGNQIIISGTATYEFNHFYKYYQRYCDIIYGRHTDEDGNIVDADASEYAVIRIPYDQLPYGLMDHDILEQGRAIMETSIFQMEYGAVFASDSEGFFQASVLNRATCSKRDPIKIDGEFVHFYVELTGDPKYHYVLGLDPASERDNLAISILKLCGTHVEHVYTWSTNRKRFNADRKKNKGHYTGIHDYNTFIVRKIHDLLKRFNIVRIHIDSGGGGISLKEGLKDPSKLREGDSLILDMDDEDAAGEDGRHILRMCQFSNRDWYEGAHYSLLKQLTMRQYLFPEYDSIAIEKSILSANKYSMMIDSVDGINGEIEEAKYQTTLIQETSSAKNQKKWDLPKIQGVVSDSIKTKLRKDHFTSVLLVNDAAQSYINDSKIQTKKTVGGGSAKDLAKKTIGEGKRYYGKGLKGNNSSPFNTVARLNQGESNSGNVYY